MMSTEAEIDEILEKLKNRSPIGRFLFAVAQAEIDDFFPETGEIVATFKVLHRGECTTEEEVRSQVKSVSVPAGARRFALFEDTRNAEDMTDDQIYARIEEQLMRHLRTSLIFDKRGDGYSPWFRGRDEEYSINTAGYNQTPQLVRYTPRLVNPHAAAAFAAGA